MALELFINKNCAFKRQNEESLTVSAMKKAFLLKSMSDFLVEKTKLSLEEVLHLKLGMENSDVQNESLADIKEWLEKNTAGAECAQCTAKMDTGSFGCYARIAYPLSKDFEEKLTAEMPPANSVAFRLLQKAREDIAVNTEEIENFRKSGFLESKKVFTGKVNLSFFKQVKISSDFFLQMLLFSGSPLGVTHMKLTLLFMGVIPADFPVRQLLQGLEGSAEMLKVALAKNRFTGTKESVLINALIVAVLHDAELAVSI